MANSSGSSTHGCFFRISMDKNFNWSSSYLDMNMSHCQKENIGISFSQGFYTYVTPFVLTIGIVGNILSIVVFMSKNMRKLSASTYLAALSVSDICALFFYVFIDWLRRGLPYFPGKYEATFLEEQGLCQLQTYLSYVSRFVSAWIIVTFTVERYIGVCHPLKRKDICGSRSSQKVIASVIVIALVLMVYKPALTGRHENTRIQQTVARCSRNPNLPLLSFILDSIFALSITFVPFLLISILNFFIIRRLYLRNRRYLKKNIVTEESIIRMEFTVILLVVSFVYVVLNLPYFYFWCKRFLEVFQSKSAFFDHSEAELLVTRVVFYLNYCINFFLYSVTGAYFRKELKVLFWYQKYHEVNNCSRLSNHSNHSTRHSWV
ncbi:unnamed protein product [Candidula unifasciata]|uniref:G-protein coupled receptors family 1 profile domain-containing protein n=1 Tax=Candidula unifasciata TaxID=100452 RepID=A0A8S4A8E6_9EUPU|nr:unnamed protein product [Candidula unifasciata]